MVVLHIICSSDLCEQAGNHLNDVFYGHVADLVSRSLITLLASESLAIVGEGFAVFICYSLDVGEVLDLDV